MLDKLDAALNFYSTALQLRGKRQEVLAGNIANADTPNYKARDFEFKATLNRALEQPGGPGRTGGLTLSLTSPRHIEASAPASMSSIIDLKYRVPPQPTMDGNTVDMNVARVEFMQNALHYQSDLQIIGSKIKGLRKAMQPAR